MQAMLGGGRVRLLYTVHFESLVAGGLGKDSYRNMDFFFLFHLPSQLIHP